MLWSQTNTIIFEKTLMLSALLTDPLWSRIFTMAEEIYWFVKSYNCFNLRFPQI